MIPKTYFIENPYEATLTIKPLTFEPFKDGKQKRRERRKNKRKN